VKYVGAMQHPGGGINDIPDRAKRHFYLFNMVLPASVQAIFGPIIKYHFKEKYFTPDFNKVVNNLCGATIKLWNRIA
jgi:dynein heavy chain